MLVDRRGQSTVEYAVLAAVVVGALLAMQIYLKRGVSGKYRAAGDSIGDQFNPVSTTSNITTTRKVTREEKTEVEGKSSSTIKGEETQSRTGSETVADGVDKEQLFYP